MNDINYVILIGRLTSDPVLKFTQTGNNFCTFSIANNRRFKKQNGEIATETNFFNCIVWGKLSDFTKNYLKKGMQIVIEGRLRQNSWQNEEGKTQSSINVVVNNIQILTPKSSTQTGSTTEQPDTSSHNAQSSSGMESNSIEPIPEGTDDDIPF